MLSWTGSDMGGDARGTRVQRGPDPPPIIVVPTAEGQWWCSLCGHYEPVTHEGICVDAAACCARWVRPQE